MTQTSNKQQDCNPRGCRDRFIKHDPLRMEEFAVTCQLVPIIPHLISGSLGFTRDDGDTPHLWIGLPHKARHDDQVMIKFKVSPIAKELADSIRLNLKDNFGKKRKFLLPANRGMIPAVLV